MRDFSPAHLLDGWSDEQLAKLVGPLEEKLAYGRIEDYYPETGPLRRQLYPKHQQFFAAGAQHALRVMIAANRVGKTEGVGCYELVLHMTGDYPAWWTGKRFLKPIRAWACGDYNKTVREILQPKLLGPWNEFGKGLVPRERLHDWTRKQGVAESVDSFTVRHVSGGLSRCVLLSYETGQKGFQGTEQDVILLDEEPPIEIYSECRLRLMTTNGMLMLTFTPLSGMTALIKHMRSIKAWEITATWDDVPHLSKQQKDDLWRDTPDHEREARSKGVPSRGSGVVFPVSEESLLVDPFTPPRQWAQIGGLDFGWAHFTAAIRMVHNRDDDVIILMSEYGEREKTPLLFSAGVKPWGAWLPWAWPHDGLRKDKDPQAGRKVAELYAEHGMKMLPMPASHSDDKLDYSVEPGVLGMLEYMQAGRFKVVRTCENWRREFRDFHRKDGIIVKEDDDFISASRYAFMMRRHAVCPPAESRGPPRRVNWRTA